MKILKNPFIKILVSFGLFLIIFLQLDVHEVFQNIQKVNFPFILLAIVLLLLNYLVSSVRWKKLLIFENSSHITVRYLTGLYFIGAFFNNFMPTSIGGDVYKAVKLGGKIGSKTNAISATFMERFTGVVTLVVISYLGLVKTLPFWISFLPEFFSENRLVTTVLELGVFFGFWVVLVLCFYFLKVLSTKYPKLGKFYKSLVMYSTRRDVIVYAVVTSLLVQLIAILTQYFVFSSLGTFLPLYYALMCFPMVTLASFFIPSINGVGVQDILYIQLFLLVGVSIEISVAASILYHLLRLVVSLVGGFIYAIGKDY